MFAFEFNEPWLSFNRRRVVTYIPDCQCLGASSARHIAPQTLNSGPFPKQRVSKLDLETAIGEICDQQLNIWITERDVIESFQI